MGRDVANGRFTSDSAPAKGRGQHPASCECTRCVGFLPANQHHLVHGAYRSPSRFGEEIAATAAELSELVPAFRDSDGPLVSLLALGLVRISKAEPAIAAAEEAGDFDSVARLRQDQRQWANSAARMLDSLGMSPSSRARLGLDVAMTRRALSVVELHAEAFREQAIDGVVVDAIEPSEEPAA